MPHVKNGKTYVNTTVIPSQTYTLPFTFRGFNQFHKYSNKQLESTKQLLYYITNRDNIDLHVGLYDWIKRHSYLHNLLIFLNKVECKLKRIFCK